MFNLFELKIPRLIHIVIFVYYGNGVFLPADIDRRRSNIKRITSERYIPKESRTHYPKQRPILLKPFVTPIRLTTSNFALS